MKPQAIASKTRKGEEEIQSRKYALERNLRYMLILVDGKSTIEQLINEKGSHLADVEAGLHTLAVQGFIAIDGVSLCEGGDDCMVPASDDISALKAALVAAARDILGADAGSIVSRLEAAPESREGLQETVNNCKKVVRLLIDEQKADALLARCATILQGIA
ncbi:MAG: hypothetical protein WCX90_07980 [Thiohalomonadaceae bacterium]|jgi:hypothetical protein